MDLALRPLIHSPINPDRWIEMCLASGLMEGTIRGGTLVGLLQHPRMDRDRNY